jgi:hypothetical protein
MIHHLSIAARDPQHVAEVLAEFMGGAATRFAPNPGSWFAHQDDEYGTGVEVYPAGTELRPAAVMLVVLCFGTSMTQTGTLRPSGRYSVVGTISEGRPAKSLGSCHFSTNARMQGHEYGRTSELASVRGPVPLWCRFSFGQESAVRMR